VWAKGVVVATPALDDDLGLLERGEDLAVEQLVAELTSVTPIERIASATVRPCAVSTSTCRSLATISSGLCRFLNIDPSSKWLGAIPQGGPLQRGQARGARTSRSPHANLSLFQLLAQPDLRTALLHKVRQNTAGRPHTARLCVALRRDCLGGRSLRFQASFLGRAIATFGELGRLGRLSKAG